MFSSLLQLSMQLFDGRADFHKISCQYALELINLHKKKRPEFIEILVRVMLTTLRHVSGSPQPKKDLKTFIKF